MSDIPIRDPEDSIKINFVSLIEVNKRTNMSYQFDYATNLKIEQKTAPGRALAGRRRWKIENEEHIR